MQLRDKRVFITEDNLNNRAMMQLLLEKAGAIVSFERWGHDTVPRLQAFLPVDVILLDLMFPDQISGYEIFQRIRAVPELQHIPVIAVSASDPDEALHKTREMGFNGFIAKPITDYTLFIEQMVKVLEGKQVWYVND